MNTFIERLMGVDTLTDQIVAMDLLMSAKTGIKLYAVAATESATPELRATFERHLFEAIEMHAKMTEYAMERGFYHPYDEQEQFRLERTNVTTALGLPG